MRKNSSSDSVISSENLFSSFSENLFSTSPLVFNEITITLNNIEAFDEEINKAKKQFEVVLKDILIIGLKKKIEKYKLDDVKKQFQLVLKDIVIANLKKKIEKYTLGYIVHISLIDGNRYYID